MMSMESKSMLRLFTMLKLLGVILRNDEFEEFYAEVMRTKIYAEKYKL